MKPEEQAQAAALLKPLNGEEQDALDELGGLMSAGQIKTNRLACLRGIVRNIKAGDFMLSYGVKYRADREQARGAQPVEAAPKEDAVAVLREHARMLGVPEDEYFTRFLPKMST